jgi:hypothetical protein
LQLDEADNLLGHTFLQQSPRGHAQASEYKRSCGIAGCSSFLPLVAGCTIQWVWLVDGYRQPGFNGKP